MQRRGCVAAVARRALGCGRGIREPGVGSADAACLQASPSVQHSFQIVPLHKHSNYMLSKLLPILLRPPPQIGFEWDRIVLHRMLNKIISQPQADNKARRLPRLKVGRLGWAGWGHLVGCGWDSEWISRHMSERLSASGLLSPACCCVTHISAAMFPLLWFHPPPPPPPSLRSCCTTCRSSQRQECTRATSAWSWTRRRRWAGSALGWAGCGCYAATAVWSREQKQHIARAPEVGGLWDILLATPHSTSPTSLTSPNSSLCPTPSLAPQSILSAGMGPRSRSTPTAARSLAVVDRLRRRLRSKGLRASFNLQMVRGPGWGQAAADGWYCGSVTASGWKTTLPAPAVASSQASSTPILLHA